MKDKVILVTGANRGIGLNIIQRLNNDGYTVIGTSRTSDGANIISQEIKSTNGKGFKMDVTNQESINSAIKNIQDEYKLTYLFISHDLKVIRSMSDYIFVMKDGKIVESGHANNVFEYPKEKYTKKLLSAALRYASE